MNRIKKWIREIDYKLYLWQARPPNKADKIAEYIMRGAIVVFGVFLVASPILILIILEPIDDPGMMGAAPIVGILFIIAGLAGD